MAFAPLYECPKCDETWRVTPHEVIDTVKDDVWTELHCDICGSNVWKEKKINGRQCFHALSDDEMKQEQGFYNT